MKLFKETMLNLIELLMSCSNLWSSCYNTYDLVSSYLPLCMIIPISILWLCLGPNIIILLIYFLELTRTIYCALIQYSRGLPCPRSSIQIVFSHTSLHFGLGVAKETTIYRVWTVGTGCHVSSGTVLMELC